MERKRYHCVVSLFVAVLCLCFKDGKAQEATYSLGFLAPSPDSVIPTSLSIEWYVSCLHQNYESWLSLVPLHVASLYLSIVLLKWWLSSSVHAGLVFQLRLRTWVLVLSGWSCIQEICFQSSLRSNELRTQRILSVHSEPAKNRMRLAAGTAGCWDPSSAGNRSNTNWWSRPRLLRCSYVSWSSFCWS